MDLSSIANTINYKYQSSSSKIQFGGMFSGLDTSSIIDALLSTDVQRAETLNTKYKQLDLKQKAYQQLDDKLESFMSFLSNFKLQSTLLAKKVDTTSEILNVSANASSTNGTYYIKVLSTATYSSFVSGRTIGPDNIDGSTTFGSLNYRYAASNSELSIQKGSSTYAVSISTSDTINDIISKLELAFGSGNVTFSNGKLKIESSEAFAIRQTSGTFMQVFNLSNAPITQSGSTYSIESTAHVGAISSSKTLSEIASYRGLTLSAGEIEINDVSISFSTTTTLSQLIDAINESSAGVTARYDESSDKIIFTSTSTGSNTISIEDNATGLSQLLGLDVGVFNVGSSAHIQVSNDLVNWTDLYSSSNTFNYSGLTITAKGVSSSTQVVNITNDIDATVEQIKEFVNQWNELMEYMHTKLSESKVTGKEESEMTEEEMMQGVLKNDSLLRRVFEKMRGFITTAVSGDVKYLWELGITTGSYGYQNMISGTIEIDEDTLRAKIEQDPEAVWAFFGNSDEGAQGLAQQIQQYIREVTKIGGQIDSVAGSSGSLNREKRVLAQQLAGWLERIQKKEQTLWAKFSAMEEAVAKMQSLSTYLSNISTKSSS
ncbi:MAG: flagellar filament capping protein FliD [Pseudothermotoga sp.]